MAQSECKWMVVRLIGMYCLVQAFLAAAHLMGSYEVMSAISPMKEMDKTMLSFVKSAEASFKNSIITLVVYSFLSVYFLKWGGLAYRIVSISKLTHEER